MSEPASSESRTPLAGQRVLITRARKQAAALSGPLRKLGAEVLEVPSIEIRAPRSYKPLDTALRNLGKYDWLILTSVNGVEALFARLKKLRLSPAALARLSLAAIGPATRAAIEEQGLKVAVMPKQYVAESVVYALRAKVRKKRVLLVRARVARDVIPAQLRKTAAVVDIAEAYETVIPPTSRPRLLRALKDPARRPTVITFTSSSTARNFVELLGPEHTYSGLLDGVRFASIGPVTSATLREVGLPVHIEARSYTIPGLVEAIVRGR